MKRHGDIPLVHVLSVSFIDYLKTSRTFCGLLEREYYILNVSIYCKQLVQHNVMIEVH